MTAAGTPVSVLSELAGAPALAVVAHPDDESFGLGAILTALTEAGSEVRVLCLTAGEASTLGGHNDLAETRKAELEGAARELGLGDVFLDGFSDGALAMIDEEILDETVDRHLGHAVILVTFEPGGVTGHPDHRAASAAASRAAARHGLQLIEWGVAPGVATSLRQELRVPFTSLDGPDVVEIVVDRTRQLAAIACHASQSVGNAVVARRLELQGTAERFRLRRPSQPAAPGEPDDGRAL